MPRAVAHGSTVALPQPQPLAPRILEGLRALPDSPWVDRLLRGRAWIFVIGIALIGLVFMQVSMLEMNAGIGRAVEKTGTLERQNADLRATVSQLSSEERIQREAAQMGLVMPPAGEVHYLTSRGPKADAARAAKVMRAPSPEAQQTAAEGADLAAAGAVATAGTTAPQAEPLPPPTPAAQQQAATTAATQPPAAPEQQPAAPAPQQQAAPPQGAPAPPQQQAAAPQAEPAPSATGAAVAPGAN
jgi:cell division protein FtsL